MTVGQVTHPTIILGQVPYCCHKLKADLTNSSHIYAVYLKNLCFYSTIKTQCWWKLVMFRLIFFSKYVHFFLTYLCNFSFHQTHALLDKHGFIGWLYLSPDPTKKQEVKQAHSNTCPCQLTHRKTMHDREPRLTKGGRTNGETSCSFINSFSVSVFFFFTT